MSVGLLDSVIIVIIFVVYFILSCLFLAQTSKLFCTVRFNVNVYVDICVCVWERQQMDNKNNNSPEIDV